MLKHLEYFSHICGIFGLAKELGGRGGEVTFHNPIESYVCDFASSVAPMPKEVNCKSIMLPR